jgi:hypothetical protein
MYRKSSPAKGLLIGLLIVSTIATFLILRGTVFSPGKQAKEVVEEFYRYEQTGDFSKSWGLFHSTMKERFGKGDYIQDRAHVFMNHFGVETFTFELGKPEKLKKWSSTKGGPAMKNTYKIPVTQTYKSKYGNLQLNQEIFVTKEKEHWKIIWDYNR